jgi:hypothetical protein
MDYLFFQMTAINGFDASGHYLRAGLLINPCSTYAIEKTTGCEATFSKAGAGSGNAAGRSLYLRREAALLGGMPIDEVLRRFPEPGAKRGKRVRGRPLLTTGGGTSSGSGSGSSSTSSGAPMRMPDAILPSSGTTEPTPEPAPASSGSQASGGGQQQAASSSSSSAPAAQSPTGRLLDYLLGGGK